MIEGAKNGLRNFIADVYITIDQRKGASGGKLVQKLCYCYDMTGV